MFGFPLGSSSLAVARFIRTSLSSLCLAACCAFAVLICAPLNAQQGDAAIHGTISDQTGAVIRNAKVTVTDTATGIQVTRTTNGSGDYSVGPLQPGHYIVEVAAKGFQHLVQQDITLDALQVLGLNLKLTIGSDTETITVTGAPPFLDTQDASIGGTIENELYSELPLSMGGSPRDPTAFAFLMPGVQESPNTATGTTGPPGGTGTFGGSGQENLNETYLDGVPVSNISAQGDSTPIRNAVSVDAVDQFQVKTNGASVGFGGVGVTNFNIKSGGNTLHGSVFDYIRNTIFDTWGYFSKAPGANGYATKPGEHQNSYGGSLGGPIIKDKLFYFATYEGFHYTKISNTPQYLTVPTLRERTGDFTDAFGTSDASSGINNGIFDPSAGQNRPQFQGLLNGRPTFNVINQSQISSISQYLASALPAPTNLSTTQNYLAGVPLQNDDYTIDASLDYTVNPKHKFRILGVGGNRGFGGQPQYKNQNQLPFPYADAAFTNQKTATGVLTYVYVPSQSLVNSLKYSYSRVWSKAFATTLGTPFTSAAAGIKNTPPGLATDTMPSVTFSGGAATAEPNPTSWASRPSSGSNASNTFTIIDNLQWTKGRHNLTFGLQIQWLETNQAGFGGYSSTTALTFQPYDTENLNNLTGGSAYASFLIGAVEAANVRTQIAEAYGGRYHPMAPYVEDSWRVNSRLTLNLGLRYDYLQPYHEVQDRIAFINPDITNPITGTKGVVMYAGHGKGPTPAFDPYICQCRTPVHPYNGNIEPRVSFVYAVRPTTVVRGNWGIMNTHAGGTGGNVNATAGTGNDSEFTSVTSWAQSGSTGLPAFFLNPSILGAPANSVYAPGNPGGQADFQSLPPWVAAGQNINPLATTGNYTFSTQFPQSGCANPAGNFCNTNTQNYADPHYGGRGPQFVNYNFGIEQMINKKAVLQINYAGSQTHFLPGGSGRGPATNSIPPEYGILLGALPAANPQPPPGFLNKSYDNLLSSGATPAVIARVQTILPDFKLPYAGFAGPSATVGRALSAFPQYNGFADIWGETGNSDYHSLQISIIQRPWHNLSGFANYTRSKTMDDTGRHRTQWPVGPAVGNFNRFYTASQIDHSLSTFNQTNAINVTWLYVFPFGRGQKFGATNRYVSLVAGGWRLSGIYKYRDGNPIQITSSGCQAGQGTCLPDYAPGFNAKSARINGRWGRGPGATASNINSIQYINPAAFVCPDSGPDAPTATCSRGPSSFKLGNIARSAPYNLVGPGWWDIDLGLRRTFSVIERPSLHLAFELGADVINVTNSTFFNLSSSGSGWNVCAAGQTIQQCPGQAFGTIGGQNQNVPPRDWQLAGRFRF